MRKYVTINEWMQCETKELPSPVLEDDRKTLLFAFPTEKKHSNAIANAVNQACEDLFRIVETDNFGGDYPHESFLLYPMKKKDAQRIADAINEAMGGDDMGTAHPRFWKVEPSHYILGKGFEP